MAKTKKSAQIYQLKITLASVKPPIWRRVQTKDCSLAGLHDLVQRSMGWTHSHLHEFEIGGERYGEPDPDGFVETVNEKKAKLSQVVDAGLKKFRYTYDLGDCWDHIIQVEKVLESEAGVGYPRCIAGARACPPEDCGGPWGYGDFLKAIENPRHVQHEDMLEWIGGEFDPEAFDVEAVSKGLR